MPSYTIQPTFSGGEFSPSLYSRIDIQKYGTALRKAKNAIVHPQGGVSNRPGMKFLGETKFTAKKSRVIPFEISLTNSFAIEAGDFYFRFWKNDGLILLTGSPYEVTTPYGENDLVDLKFIQSNDILFLVHPNYKPRKLIHYSDTDWALEEMELSNGPFMSTKNLSTPLLLWTNPSANSTANIVFYQPTLSASMVGSLIKLNYTIPSTSFQSSLDASNFYTLESVAETDMRLTLSGTWAGTVVVERSVDSGNSWVTATSYTGNTTNTAHTVTASSPGSTTNRFRLKITLSSGTVNYTMNGDASIWGTSSYVLTLSLRNVTGSFSNTNTASPSIWVKGKWRLYTKGTWDGEIAVEKSTDHGSSWSMVRAYSSTTSSSINVDGSGEVDELCLVRVRLTRALSSGPINLDLSRDAFELDAIVKLNSVTNDRTGLCTIVKGTMVATPTKWQEGSFSELRGYPKTIIFHQDRLCFGSTKSEPQATWCSQTGDYGNFGTSSSLKDTDSISLNLPSRKTNDIKNMVALKDIITFTSASEWKLGASGDVLTPTSATQSLQENIGSNSCVPVLVGNRAIFVSPMGTVVRDIGYDYSVDGFVGGNLSIFSTHLFADYSIIEMAYQQEPDSIVWAIRNDGKLLSLTYMREQQVQAWTWHETDGLFESICTLPGDGQNDIYFIVNRDGKRYMEKMGKRLTSSDPVDAFFVDSGLSYSGTPISSVSGLGHLEGKTVSVLADGYVLPQKIVSSGSISLGASYSKIHVGLPYESDIETLNIEIQVQDGISYGRALRVAEARISFLKSRGGYIGGSEDHLDELVQLSGADLGSPLEYFTGEFSQTIDSSYDEGGRIFFRQSDPLPMTILAIMPKVVFGG